MADIEGEILTLEEVAAYLKAGSFHDHGELRLACTGPARHSTQGTCATPFV